MYLYNTLSVCLYEMSGMRGQFLWLAILKTALSLVMAHLSIVAIWLSWTSTCVWYFQSGGLNLLLDPITQLLVLNNSWYWELVHVDPLWSHLITLMKGFSWDDSWILMHPHQDCVDLNLFVGLGATLQKSNTNRVGRVQWWTLEPVKLENLVSIPKVCMYIQF